LLAVLVGCSFAPMFALPSCPFVALVIGDAYEVVAILLGVVFFFVVHAYVVFGVGCFFVSLT